MKQLSRTSFSQCLGFLSCVRDGLSVSGVKERLGLSRYSYDYALNRLLKLGLVVYDGERVLLTDRGLNVLTYRARASAGRDEAELKAAQHLP
jgi:DNA-binding IclR family transcriptional regulator